MITYTAVRSIANGHAVNKEYSLDFETVSADYDEIVEKTIQRAKSGAMETIYNRTDKQWSIQLQPLSGRDLELLKEFLGSTNAGEIFYLYAYGTEATPLRLRRTDSGYKLVMFQALGAADRDYLQASTITAIEA